MDGLRNIRIDQIHDELFTRNKIEVSMLRLDLIDELISGNKYFKLKQNLEYAKLSKGIVTYGGAYSNHIIATAAAASHMNIKSAGIIRGEKVSNKILNAAGSLGMKLEFITREEYRRKATHMEDRYNGFYYIPEGGNNQKGVAGCGEIADFIPGDITSIIIAAGTGCTIEGLSGKNRNFKIYGVPVLKNIQYPDLHHDSIALWNEYHFGGYAKTNKILLEFISCFQNDHNIPLDFVYTGKMMFALYDKIKMGYFSPGEKVLAIHTGGYYSAPV